MFSINASSFWRDCATKGQDINEVIVKENVPARLTELYGEVQSLNTVVRMSLSEQKRVNERLAGLCEKLDSKVDELRRDMDARLGEHRRDIDATRNKVYWFSGAVAACTVVITSLAKILGGLR